MGDPGETSGLEVWAARLNRLLRASVLLAMVAVAALLPTRSADGQVTLLRSFAIVVLAFLPSWLFLRFVTIRAHSVWNEFVLNLHRLGIDRPGCLPRPPVNSIYHRAWSDDGGAAYEGESNLYRDKFDAYYGRTTVGDRGKRSLPKAETFFPVFLATAVFAAGWTTVLGGTFLARLATHEVDGLPTADMLRIGFVGAYLFTLQMLIRRYFQADLKASAYVNAVARIVVALAVVMVVDMSVQQGAGGGARVAAAFVIGFFPIVGLQAIQKGVAVALRTVVPSLRNDYPLSDLDGLSVWYEARLLELGIEDMENLATANLVDVILHSRVPVSRLVDWVDQAHLYLHLEPKKGKVATSREILRRLGVRTATALEDAMRPCPVEVDACARGLVPAAANEQLLIDLRSVLNHDGLTASVTTSLLKVFDHAPNLKHVRAWKRDWTQPLTATSAFPVPPAPRALAAANGH